jgi:hypothetical protein
MSQALIRLAKVVRRKFPTADGITYGRDEDGVILWQVLAGDDVVWDAGPEVTATIPRWDGIGEAIILLSEIARTSAPEFGFWLVLRLP